MPTINENILNPIDRIVVDTNTVTFKAYDRYGVPNPSMDWIPLSGNECRGWV